MTGGVGDNTLVGGEGVDTAFLTGNFADYLIGQSGGAITAQDQVGKDGVDTLTEFELFGSADQTVNVADLFG